MVGNVNMEVENLSHCGGYDVVIHLIQGKRECKTDRVEETWAGKNHFFGRGTCKNIFFHVEQPSIDFKLITKSENAFCLKAVQIEVGKAIFRSKNCHQCWHNKNNNDKLYTAYKIN